MVLFFVESFQVIPPQMVLAFVETFDVLHVALAEKVLDKICQFEEGPDPKISEKCPKSCQSNDDKFTSQNGVSATCPKILGF